MPISTKTYDQFLSDEVNGFAGLVGILPNFKKGSIILAFLQAIALSGLMFIQSLALDIYQAALAVTAVGPDLDTWFAQFGFTRKPAAYGIGTVTFGLTQVTTANILIQPGTIVQTIGGGIQYQVVADASQPGWSVSQNAYVLAAGYLSVNATVKALVVGSVSNVQAGQLVQFGSSGATGVATVTNSAPILNGADPESDAAALQRFILAFNAVNANGTIASILATTLGVNGVIDVAIIENVDVSLSPLRAAVLVVIDDGTGNPSTTLKNNVYTAVNLDRAAGIEPFVSGPVLQEVTVSANIRIAIGASVGTVTLNVTNAILDLINNLEIGAELYSSQIEKAIMNADPSVIAIEPDSLECSYADTTPGLTTVFRSNNILVTLGTY